MTDPGFPRQGKRFKSKERCTNLLIFFAENCMKFKKWTGAQPLVDYPPTTCIQQ